MTSTPQLPAPTWFVGCGNMGQAIVEGWRTAGIDLSQVVVIRPSGTPVEGVRTVRSLPEAGIPPRLVVLAVKPQKLDEVAAELKPWITGRTTILSILAGVEAASLRQRFPAAGAIVRAMPNLPVAIRRGVTALYTDSGDEALKRQLGDLFVALGWAMWTVDEAKFGAVGEAAGAGPAYVARFIDALRKAAEARGLSPEIAATVALETVLGTAWMAASTGETMDESPRRVASPGGTTEAGLAVLDQDSALDRLVASTIEAASRRDRELGQAAKAPSLAEEGTLH
jgi:pyrroline-5-carboxylate reductase